MGKGHRTCEVCGAKEKHAGDQSLLFSKFPLEPSRCREWLKAVGNEELVHLPIEKLHDQRNVCANHFRRTDFNKKGNRLNRHAIPTLGLMAEGLTETQLAEFPLHVWRDKRGTLDKINKINEDHCYNNGKVHVDHSYSLQHRPFYQSDIELIAELSDYTEKRYAGQTKESEGQENSNTTSNDIIAENEDRSQITSKGLEVQTCQRNSTDKGNSNSSSNDFDSVKPNGSQINSKSRNNTNRNNSNSNAHERNSAIERYTYSFNLTSDNVIDVIRNESDITGPQDITAPGDIIAPEDVTAPEDIIAPADVTAPEAQTCVTDDKEYRFDGDYFDDGLPTIVEPEPEVPEAVFSWQTELNLFPLDDVVNLEDDLDLLDLGDDAVCPDARAQRARPALAADASLYDPGAPEEALDAEYQCNECQKEITGFRYTCVQCADWDLCGACEARGEHAAHYLLRIPTPRPFSEIQTVLAAIRQQLLSENLFLRQEFADNDWPPEVKEERGFGEDSAGEHTRTEDSSDESDSSASPRRKRARPAPPAAAGRAPPRGPHTEHADLTDDVLLHISSENEQLFSPELSVAKQPDSVPVASTEIPKDLIASILSSRNPSEARTYDSFKSLARGISLGGNSLLKPTRTEMIPEDPLGIDCNCIGRLASDSPKVADNLTEQQTKKTPVTNQQCDDLPTIIIEDDTVENSVPQLIQQPTLPVNVLRTNAIKMIARDSPVSARPVGHRITRAQFIDKGFDDNLPIVTLEDDEDDQPPGIVPRKSLQQPNDLPKLLAHNSPTRMDIDSSPAVHRVTRSKRKFEKVTVYDKQSIQKDKSLLQTLGGALQTIDGAIETLDNLIQEDDIVDITDEVPDTSRLTEGSETVVLRVPSSSNEAALTQALHSTALVLLEPLQYDIQKITSRKRLK